MKSSNFSLSKLLDRLIKPYDFRINNFSNIINLILYLDLLVNVLFFSVARKLAISIYVPGPKIIVQCVGWRVCAFFCAIVLKTAPACHFNSPVVTILFSITSQSVSVPIKFLDCAWEQISCSHENLNPLSSDRQSQKIRLSINTDWNKSNLLSFCKNI